MLVFECFRIDKSYLLWRYYEQLVMLWIQANVRCPANFNLYPPFEHPSVILLGVSVDTSSL